MKRGGEEEAEEERERQWKPYEKAKIKRVPK